MNFDFLIEHFRLSNPLEVVYINQLFGKNDVKFYKDLGMAGHNGIDYAANTGTHAFASIPGTVSFAGKDGSGGKSVRIVSDPVKVDGMWYRAELIYYHLDGWLVEAGETVLRSQLIGFTGNTGEFTTGPHLHWGLKIQWSHDNKLSWNKDYNNGFFGAVDPLPFLTYEKPMAYNPYNLEKDTLIKLEEGIGGFAWWNGERFYVDDLAKIQASWIAANNGFIEGKIQHFLQQAWDAYPEKYDLHNKLLT